jgi:NADPH:quinone reductase-like Zn-dependent oxidoreductase
MRAAVIESPDRPPRYGEVETPIPGPGQVLVHMQAAALSPRARSGAAGRHYSSVPGQSPAVAGIDGVGTGPDGRLVYVLALDGPMGTMAEQCVVDADRCVPVPEEADALAVAAGMIAGISSWAALTLRAPLQPGQSVLVLGATGVAGGLAVQIARALGAGRVIGAGRDPERLEALVGQGADEVVSLVGDPDQVAERLEGAAGQVDVVLDYLWGPATEQALGALLASRGDQPLRWVEIGSMAGSTLVLPSAALRSRDLHLVGCGQGSVGGRALLELMPDLVAAIAGGQLRMDVSAVPLAQVESTWEAPAPSGRRTVFTI